MDANHGNSYRYSSGTAAWLSGTALDTDHIVVLCEHLSSVSTMNWNAQSLTNGSDVTSALQSFVNNGGTLIQLCGHSHADYCFIDPWLTIYTICQKFDKPDTTTTQFGKVSGYVGSIVAPDRILGSSSEDSWSVMIVKPISKVIDCIRFGGGVDRHFHILPISPSTVTSKLSGTITWSSSDASIATVSGGTITGVASGKCAVFATDADGNFECWTVIVS